MMEEALLEEQIYSVMQMLAAEEHIVENLVKMKKFNKEAVEQLHSELNEIRSSRQKMIPLLFSKEENDVNNSDFRTTFNARWCTIKHLLLAKVHLDECIMKTKSLDNLQKTISINNAIYKILKDIISSIKKFNLESCGRCEEDTGIKSETKDGKIGFREQTELKLNNLLKHTRRKK